MFHHRIEQDQEFAHTGHESHFLGFTGGAQALIEGAQDRIESCGRERRHVQHRADLGAPTPARYAARAECRCRD